MSAQAVILKVVARTAGDRRAVISVSKRVLKSAAARNLIKRRIRVILQPLLSQAVGKLVVTVRQDAAHLSFQELKQELLREAKRNNIA